MTTITVSKNKDGSYKEFVCKGHAGYSDSGKDIVCASISILVINTINVLEKLGNEKLETESNEENGYIRCTIMKPLQEHSTFLIDAMVFGLMEISKEYGKKYLKVNFKEV